MDHRVIEMGKKVSKEDLDLRKGVDASISRKAEANEKIREQILKVLLLGAGESGKSTVFKQMNLLYGNGIDDAIREEFRENVGINLLTVMQGIFITLDDHKELEDLVRLESDEAEQAKQTLVDHGARWGEHIHEDIKAALHVLWADPGIQSAFGEHRQLFQIPDNIETFYERMDEVLKDDYKMTDEDLLLLRVRTTGMNSQFFNLGGATLQLIDVGGQRNERRKWIHHFDDVSTVIFITALSAFDLKCFEDELTNRMEESLDLFKKTTHEESLRNSTFILFLNKFDIFEDKLRNGVSLSNVFEDWDAANDSNPEMAVKFIENKFREGMNPEANLTTVHVTTATDPSNMHVVLSGVKQAIINASIMEAGI